ncbi:MAG: tRNA lysidine(34) synthetase TilS, partial [Candidatus Kapabacteria bacterium]|nr:tRNA lysidine(34) synthetase TilS [Candidatus Kapabacteria bacterium]
SMDTAEWFLFQVRRQLQESGVDSRSRILCAVSGGMDSVVMLALLRDLSTELGFVVGVAHADHGLRGEASQQDAEFVRHLAVEWNLPVFVETLPVREYARRHHCGIEMAARLLRYEFLQRSARAFGATHVAVAHTADDNAETVLLNLLRGAGLEGLSGIPPQRELFSDCFLIRPLLSLRKRHLHEYACSRGLLWREDVSNRELYFRRNRIRWELLPTIERIMPGALDNINRSSALLRQALSGIHQLLEPLLQQTALPDGNGFLIADSQWDALPEFFCMEFLRLGLRRLGITYSPPAHRLLQALALRAARTGKKILLSRTAILVRERSGFSLVLATAPMSPVFVQPHGCYRAGSWELEFRPVLPHEANFSPDPWTEFMDADRLPQTLCWRTPMPGDHFHPLGMPHETKLGKFLSSQRIPYWRRLSLSVLAEGHRVLWLCGIRLSDAVKITPSTRRIVRVRLRHVSQQEDRE